MPANLDLVRSLYLAFEEGDYVGRGTASGVRLREIEARSASVYRVREEKVVRLVLYWDRDAALKAVGPEA